MIDNAGSYEFVQGITNGQVLINGHIMPWRDVNYTQTSPSTDKPECLRGEDICFLYEGATRWGLSQSLSKLQYSSKISRQQLYNVWSQIRNHGFYVTLSYLRPQKTSTFQKLTYATNTINFQTVLDAYSMSTTASDLESASPAANSQLSGDYVRSLFKDFSKVKSVLVDTNVASDSPTATQTSEAIENALPSADPATPSNRVIIGEALRCDTSGSTHRSVARRWDNSSGYMLLSWPYSDLAVGGGYSAIVMFNTTAYSIAGSIYTAPNPNYTILSQVSAEYDAANQRLKVPMADIHALADEYAQTNNLYSQFYTSGRTNWPTRSSGTYYLWIEAKCVGVVTYPDFDFSDLNWQWP